MKTVRFRDTETQLQIGKILCLGRNYREHASEMNAEVPKEPVVFLKPGSSVIGDGEDVVPPPFSHELHHEVEMVVVMGKEGKHIPRASAWDYIAGYGVGLDMTLRDVQSEAKKKGLPWTVAKAFDTSAPLSPIIPKEAVGNPHHLEISLKVNGQIRQHANTSAMIFPIDEVIAYLSSIFTLEPGDLIFTGTPEGVGPVVPGDTLEAFLESVGTLRVHIRQQSAT